MMTGLTVNRQHAGTSEKLRRDGSSDSGETVTMRTNALRAGLILAVVLLATVLAVPAARAQTFIVLHVFKGGNDGAGPESTLVLDSVGLRARLVRTHDLSTAWRKAICAAESLSVVTRQSSDPVAKRLLRSRYSRRRKSGSGARYQPKTASPAVANGVVYVGIGPRWRSSTP
jgi:hypothetical protein